MKKNFKLLIKHGSIYILKNEVGIFGPAWNIVAKFSEQCISESKRIVALLNECDIKTNKDNDRERDS